MENYPITVFWSNEDDAYIAIVPDLPGCSAGGNTEIEVINEIHLAIDLWLKAATEIGNPIPKPSHPKFLSTMS
jgi:predicted RNase H-like HicB family nuclease